MRKTLFASATLLGVVLAAPGFAQTMTPGQYLQEAMQAVQGHHTLQAVSALDRAEYELLKSGVVAESHGTRDVTTDPPVLRQMGDAREAIQQHHWEQAAHLITIVREHPSASAADNGALPATGTAGTAAATQPQ